MKWLSNSLARNLILGVVFVVIVAALGVIGYMHNGWSFGDSLFMVVLTIFTVGYEEVHPLDTIELRALTIGLIALGCTGMIYLTGAIVQFITLTQIQQMLGLTRMNKQIETLSDHVIVCGFGRTGAMLSKELKAGKAKFVVIEPNPERCAEARELGYLCVHADAADEAALKQAGIERARALATVVSSDPVNVFITLSARSLNGAVQIIARGEEPSTERKLLQAGADSVILPAHIGAEQIASMILFPSIAGVIQSPERRRQMDLDLRTLGLELEVVVAAEGSVFTGLTVEEIESKAERSFFIIAVEQAGSQKAERPLPGTRIVAGDGVTILGRAGRANILNKFAEAAH
ncbi:TrkA-N domain protein [Methylocella silvestris BL2]|uniref:TrkA-N domain protein n=1 Tax=Methylocella silvestris (strain DSM 15510 / CIP 108128 / LMG 27833 / NCIMB 13906 / BL2) TaxID=395965 RepID=B8ERA4_METSB|nr:potassium channel protein [Methylocella silvestris]ACK50288.1 TrkA-N domain protein [Methylocella silvestris BL2]